MGFFFQQNCRKILSIPWVEEHRISIIMEVLNIGTFGTPTINMQRQLKLRPMKRLSVGGVTPGPGSLRSHYRSYRQSYWLFSFPKSLFRSASVFGSSPTCFCRRKLPAPKNNSVRGIPTLLLFKDGQVASMKVGSLPKSQIYDWVDSVLYTARHLTDFETPRPSAGFSFGVCRRSPITAGAHCRATPRRRSHESRKSVPARRLVCPPEISTPPRATATTRL